MHEETTNLSEKRNVLYVAIGRAIFLRLAGVLASLRFYAMCRE